MQSDTDDLNSRGDESGAEPGDVGDICSGPGEDALLPVIGLGGSAGSLEALREFFAHVDATMDAAFVVVVHLSPDHTSSLAEILQRVTPFKVRQARERERLRPRCVYVIPPGKALHSTDGHISLAPLERARSPHLTVDVFFRTLADTHGPRAVGIILSGLDGDGAIGIKRIKEHGGLTIAQDPADAAESGMPRSSIATGMVDWILPAAAMGARLANYFGRGRRIDLLPAGVSGLTPAEAPVPMTEESLLNDIQTFLRNRLGRDFSYYKRATLLRRVGRRMQVNCVDDLEAYLDCLRTRPGEATALLQDLLISVTNFFRDPDCFGALQTHIPSLFRNKAASDTVRVWVAACATGEEAYSVAMLLSEYARTLDSPPAIQVFATDLGEGAIRLAREGLYPPEIEIDVSDERLKRFFVKESSGYRVRRELRDMVMFAIHDVLRDSPFSRISLVSCRNLLIYLTREAQRRVLDTFHFSLQPAGVLFLGSSEAVEDDDAQYAVLDKKCRIYTRRNAARVGLPVPVGPGTWALARDVAQAEGNRPNWQLAALAADDDCVVATGSGRPMPWSEVQFRLLEEIAPPSVLVDEGHEILHLSPSAGRFLQHPGGTPTRDLLKAIHPSLRIALRAALYRSRQTVETIEVAPASLRLDGVETVVSIRVVPISHIGQGLTLVVFQHHSGVAERQRQAIPVDISATDPVARQLERELERLKGHLRDTVEQYEASNEELKASNEELQAMNEELRSATEELETGREELQSINEELTTVNLELKSKVDELGHANSDIHNLMDATAIATIFLDRELKVTRYTPSAVALFNLIASDIGRPLSDLTKRVDYPGLEADALQVLARLAPIEREVAADNGQWFQARVLPYRTLDDRIGGVVLTLVDVSDRKRTLEAMQFSEARFSAMVSQAPIGVVEVDLDGRIRLANRYFCDALGTNEAAVRGLLLLDWLHDEDRDEVTGALNRLAVDRQLLEFEVRVRRSDAGYCWMHMRVIQLPSGSTAPRSVLIVCADVTEQRLAQETIRDREQKLRLVIDQAVDYAIMIIDPERRIQLWSEGARVLFGFSPEEIIGRSAELLFTPEDQASGALETEIRQAVAEGSGNDDRQHQRKDGRRFWVNGALMPLRDGAGEVVGFVKIVRDQTEDREIRTMLEAASSGKDQFLAMLSHELRNPLASVSSASDALSEAEGNPRTIAKAGEIIRRQSKVMKVLLDDLLDISRIRLGRLVLQRSVTTVASVIESAVETTQSLIAADQHRLQVSVPDSDLKVDVDPVRMAQVFSNLLTNAIKYTPRGGNLRISGRRSGERAVIQVKDNGVGMKPSDIEGMFELFAQSGERSERGLGIGLALVRSIVELHDGTVTGESGGPDKGSTFTVSLPLAARLPDSGPAEAAPARTSMSVLLVDDNADLTWPIAQMLGSLGCQVTIAHSGAEALQLVEAHRPQVALVDIGMPEMDGYEVARRLRRTDHGRQMLLVAVTGWGQAEDKREAMNAGFDAHLVKPVNIADIERLMAGI